MRLSDDYSGEINFLENYLASDFLQENKKSVSFRIDDKNTVYTINSLLIKIK
jgi:hypothetical protein